VEVVEWEIFPYVRFGPVAFDMTRDDIREVLGWPEAVDNAFFHYGLLTTVGFDAQGRCNWVATSPGRPVRASVVGTDLVGDHDEVVGRLAQHGHAARQGLVDEADSGSTYVDDLGVYLGREDSDEQDLETVAAYRRGYWDE
jgi:hypothetical protein